MIDWLYYLTDIHQHMINRHLITWLMTLSLLTLVLPASAHDQQQDKIIIASFEVPPYVIQQQDGRLSGIFVERIEAASKQSGIEVEFMLTNWARAQMHTKQGHADAVWPIVKNDERQSWLDYPPAPLNQFRFPLFANKQRTFDFNGELNSLAGLTLGNLTYANAHPLFHQGEVEGIYKVEQRSSLKLLLLAMSGGRLDGFVYPSVMVEWEIRRNDIDDVEPLAHEFGTSNIYLARSKASSKVAAFRKLHQAAQQINIDEQKWLNQHFSQQAEQQQAK